MKTFKWLMLSLFSGSIILILTLSQGHTVVYKKGNRLNVLATSLNMRAKPSIKSKKIGRVPYGARATVLKKMKNTFKSEGIKGHWVKVKYDKRIGYIFDGYLTRLPAPPKNCKSLKHYADSKLGKVGKEHKKVKDQLNYSSWQNYKYNAKIEFERWWSEDVEGHSTILILKNITLEEAFLIGRLCLFDPYANKNQLTQFREKPFSKNSEGNIETYLENTVLDIKKDSKGYVRITITVSL